MVKITKVDLIKVVFRSFFIQSSWNFKRMQSLGMLYSLKPVIKKLNLEEEKIKAFMIRQLAFFNTHPYMASYILGATIKMEEELSHIEDQDDYKTKAMRIESFKQALMGSLGAIGDSFFWSTYKIFSALICVFFALLGRAWAVGIFLLIFNLPHLYIRFSGVFEGYKYGEEVVGRLKRYNFYQLIEYIEIVIAISLGIAIAASPYFINTKFLSSFEFIYHIGYILISIMVIYLFINFFKKGIHPLKILFLICLVSIIVGIVIRF